MVAFFMSMFVTESYLERSLASSATKTSSKPPSSDEAERVDRVVRKAYGLLQRGGDAATENELMLLLNGQAIAQKCLRCTGELPQEIVASFTIALCHKLMSKWEALAAQFRDYEVSKIAVVGNPDGGFTAIVTLSGHETVEVNVFFDQKLSIMDIEVAGIKVVSWILEAVKQDVSRSKLPHGTPEEAIVSITKVLTNGETSK
jgi:hypothetical protein